MRSGWKRGYRVAVVGVAALLLAGGAVAVAGAAHGGKGKVAKTKKHIAKRLVRTGVHADVSLIRADGTTDAFAVDRGTVTAASSASLTLLRPDGKSVTLSLSSTTTARGTIAVGKHVLVFSRNGAAFRVRGPGVGVTGAITSAMQTQKSPIVHLDVKFIRGDGSTGTVTLDRGQVTAASTSSLTIKRADGQSVTFTLGANVIVTGHIVVGGKALVIQRDGAVSRVFAAAAVTTATAGVAGAVGK